MCEDLCVTGLWRRNILCISSTQKHHCNVVMAKAGLLPRDVLPADLDFGISVTPYTPPGVRPTFEERRQLPR